MVYALCTTIKYRLLQNGWSFIILELGNFELHVLRTFNLGRGIFQYSVRGTLFTWHYKPGHETILSEFK